MEHKTKLALWNSFLKTQAIAPNKLKQISFTYKLFSLGDSKKKTNNDSNSDQNTPIIKKPKVRWKPLAWIIGIGTVVGVILYFIFGFNKPTYIELKAANVANSGGQTTLVLIDNNNQEWGVTTSDLEKATSYRYDENSDHYQITTLSRGAKITFPVFFNKNSNYFALGQTRFSFSFPNNGNNGSSNNEFVNTHVYNLGTLKSGSLFSPAINSNNGNSNNGSGPLSQVINALSVTKSNLSIGSNVDVVGRVLYLIPTILWVVILILMFRSLRGQAGQEGLFNVGKTTAKTVKTNVTFKDVAGVREEKEELVEIVDYLKNPNKYSVMGARTPKGVILYGPPGTGKTLLAKAVSGEANVPFFEVSGASFDDMFVGVGAKRVRDLFAKAKKSAPCIIFIDEIDAVAGKRGSNNINGTSGGIADQTINQLLSEMDGFNTKTGIVVMAATNRLDSLDEAILRPGRFDRHIQIGLPDIKERIQILNIHARNKNLSSKINLEDVARRTPGFSGAQLENVLNEATLLAVRNNKHVITIFEIDEAIDRVIAGPAKKYRQTTEEERKHIAYHEAGHALVGLYAEGGDVVEKITIIPRGQAAGYTLSTPEKQEMMLKTKKDLLAIVATTLAGRAAEEVIYGKDKITSGASNDFYKVTNIVRAMVTQLGMSHLGMTQYLPSEGPQNPYTKYYSEETAKAIDDAINDIINEQYNVALKIIHDHRQELELIVECLLLLETIVKPQIDFIHEHLKLPEEAEIAKQKLAASSTKETKQE